MSEYLGKLLVDKTEITKTLTNRKKKHIEKSVSVTTKMNKAETMELLKQKAVLEEADGWAILTTNMKSLRLKKDKPKDEQLEDELWVIMAQMGFNELSDGRSFTIREYHSLSPRQIDVFGKDGETAILIECTHCRVPQKKDMSELINKIEKMKGNIGNSIRTHYGIESHLKVGWVIATKNIEWGIADLEKAKTCKITVLREEEIEYYHKLIGLLREAAKYQFLSHVFSQEEISGLELPVAATRGTMGGKPFYNFLIRPYQLLRIAYVSHKGSHNSEDIESYQRMLSQNRLKAIAAFIDEGGQFPTNIVINLRGKIRFERGIPIGDSFVGTLYLPQIYASCLIIDGQHRLYGYMHSRRAKEENDKTTVSVLAYDNISPMDEANYFIDINSKQVKVTGNLIAELYANLRWDSPRFDDRLISLCTRTVMAMNSKYSSPICDRLATTNKTKSSIRCLTLKSFNDGLKENLLFGVENKPGPLSDSNSKDLSKTLSKGVELLSAYLNLFATELPDHWNLGNDKGGFLATNEGIRSLLKVLKGILWYIEFKDHVVVDCEPPDIILPYVKIYVWPVVTFFKNASIHEIQNYRDTSGSLKNVTKNANRMMQLINREYKDFTPSGLKDFLENMDQEGTHEAHHLIDDLERRFYAYVIAVLKSNYGDLYEQWWMEGIPLKIRKDCNDRYEDEKGVKAREQYLSLGNFRSIVTDKWELFNNEFDIGEKGGKDKKTDWMYRLNEIRNITHHSTKWPATKDQVNFVREIHSKLEGRFIVPK